MGNFYSPTLIIGLGNPILGDDGVGWRIVRGVEQVLDRYCSTSTGLDVEFEYLSLGGLSLMERMIGYHDVILVDSILTGKEPIGSIFSLPLEKLPNLSAGHTTSVHDTSLATALEVGKKMGEVLPGDVWVVAVEAESVFEFSEDLSPEVEAVVPFAIDVILKIILERIREENIYILS